MPRRIQSPPVAPVPRADAPTAPAAATVTSPAPAPAGWQPKAAAAAPAPKPTPDTAYDGAVIGEGGKPYGSKASLKDIAAVLPKNGKPSGVAIYVNGINNGKDRQAESMQGLADAMGMALVGVHNATAGVTWDSLQSAADKLGFASFNKATPTTARLIWDELAAGNSVNLVGHSQGTIVIATAIAEVRDRLMKEKGLSREQAEAALSKIQVLTFGAAATKFPDGPKYKHFVNKADPIPTYVGHSTGPSRTREAVDAVGGLADRATHWAGVKTNLKGAGRAVADAISGYAGRGAEVVAFDDPATDLKATLAPHLLQTYLKHYK